MLVLLQSNSNAFPAAGMFAGAFAILCCGGILLGLAIQAVICYLVSNCFTAIPPEFRKQEPGMVWLLMIPLFGLVWNFFVYPKLSESYQAYFAAQGRTDVGDCGKQIGLAYCIVAACCVIPHVNYLTGPAALVLLILVLVKAYELKNKISAQPPQ